MTVVGQVGGLVDTGDRAEPFRLVDPAGEVVPAVAAYFRELQASGRSAATLRSYGMDLLRWFRFCWAVGLDWDRATRTLARDFSRWLQISGKPVRPHWRGPSATEVEAAGPVQEGRPTRRRSARTARRCCAASTTFTATRAAARS